MTVVETVNSIFKTDSYKFTHWNQYPMGTEFISFYGNARHARLTKPVVYFGMQPIVKELSKERVTEDDVYDAKELCKAHFGRDDVFNFDGFNHIVYQHHGRWPVSIYSLPEGTVVRDDRALFVVENTCPQCFWVPSFLETRLDQVWAPSSVASRSYNLRVFLNKVTEDTGADPNLTQFKVHDFGVRGTSSMESAALCGMGHLLSFTGTDNVPALAAAQKYYRADMAGFSVPASEHSVATSYGKECELQYIHHMIHVNKGGIVSVVMDSYDVFEAVDLVEGFLPKLRADGTTLVIRPDSGYPTLVIHKILSKLSHLMTPNEQGYFVLPKEIRIIQGDGMTLTSISELVLFLTQHKFSLDNIVFGMGSGMLQEIRRDEFGFTMKASHIRSAGYDGPIWKESEGKSSKKGIQKTPDMKLIFNEGRMLYDWSWDEVKKRIWLDQKI